MSFKVSKFIIHVVYFFSFRYKKYNTNLFAEDTISDLQLITADIGFGSNDYVIITLSNTYDSIISVADFILGDWTIDADNREQHGVYQYLNKEKTIAYCGSLVQQNFGESINSHGMLLWNLRTKTSKLIEVPNDYIYKTHLITDIKDYEIPDIVNKLCRLRVLYKDVERLDLIKYEKEIKSRYNIIQFVKQEISEDEIITKKSDDNSVQNKKFMEVYMEYLKNNKIKFTFQ